MPEVQEADHMVRDSLPEELRPYEDDLYRMMRDAVRLYLTAYPPLVRATISTVRGQRNDVHDCMSAVSKTMFPYEQRGQLFLIRLGRYCIRPKKLSAKLETANYPTQAALNFNDQITYSLFPELEMINANVGYVPDPI